MRRQQDILLSVPVDWNGVRPIYKKLSEEFHILLSAFDISIDETSKIYLDHLICCIDRVDLILDGITNQQQRQDLSNAMIGLIGGTASRLPVAFDYPLLLSSLLNLRSIAERLNIQSKIIKAAHVIFIKTEDKRHQTNIDTFLSLVQKEGEATAVLPLSIIGDRTNENFTNFFTRLCRLMGIADLIVDAKSDYHSKLISFKPTVTIYLRLIRITVAEGFKLLRMIPHKFKFLKYCFRFLTILVKHG